jgi:hypothetical protein
MSKSALRKDKTCLNCKHVVDLRYCPNCGQENTDSRKTFHHLFIHFFEDLTHYENAFWRTIKNLLFKPASLTKEYLSGKRLSYLAPVRLYIFISFITFFLFTVTPNPEDHLLKAKQTASVKTIGKDGKLKDSLISKDIKVSEMTKVNDTLQMVQDSINTLTNTNLKFKNRKGDTFLNLGYNSVEQLDSVQKASPPDEKFSDFEYDVYKKFILVKKNNTKEQIIEKFKESFIHNLPKVLFIYMPLFAFFLWLFHNKKRWYYFDHGIFTLHYFSFLLLVFLLLFLIDVLLTWNGNDGFLAGVNHVIRLIGFGWMFYYFFPAHHRFYGESRIISFLKSIMLFWINCILIFFILVILRLTRLLISINYEKITSTGFTAHGFCVCDQKRQCRRFGQIHQCNFCRCAQGQPHRNRFG